MQPASGRPVRSWDTLCPGALDSALLCPRSYCQDPVSPVHDRQKSCSLAACCGEGNQVCTDISKAIYRWRRGPLVPVQGTQLCGLGRPRIPELLIIDRIDAQAPHNLMSQALTPCKNGNVSLCIQSELPASCQPGVVLSCPWSDDLPGCASPPVVPLCLVCLLSAVCGLLPACTSRLFWSDCHSPLTTQ